MAAPRLLLDGRMVRGTLHGIGRYSYCVAVGVARLRPDWTVGVWTAQPEVWAEARRELPSLQPQQVQACPFSLREQWELPRSARQFRADLVHYTSIAVPLWMSGPALISVHDLTPLWFPPTPLHPAYIRHLFSRLARRARRVICGSQHSSRDIQQVLGVHLERIDVVPYGGLDGPATPRLEANTPVGSEASGRPYFLCVSNPKPHKNLRVLLEAYQGLEPQADLVLVSPGADWLDRALEGRVSIRRLHGISDAGLGQLYRGALAVVVPSLYEGFGIPPLEAMQLGAPVISSNATSLPEVVGRAGLLFDPQRSDQLRDCMQQLLSRPDLRAQLLEAGARQAQLFTWEASARAHVKIYERVLREQSA